MRDFFSDLEACLSDEFYADNFRRIAQISREAADQTERPLRFFILWVIFHLLDVEWRERPLSVKVADRMKKHLAPHVLRYLQAAPGGLSPEVESEYLNHIVRTFLSWLDVQRDIP